MIDLTKFNEYVDKHLEELERLIKECPAEDQNSFYYLSGAHAATEHLRAILIVGDFPYEFKDNNK